MRRRGRMRMMRRMIMRRDDEIDRTSTEGFNKCFEQAWSTHVRWSNDDKPLALTNGQAAIANSVAPATEKPQVETGGDTALQQHPTAKKRAGRKATTDQPALPDAEKDAEKAAARNAAREQRTRVTTAKDLVELYKSATCEGRDIIYSVEHNVDGWKWAASDTDFVEMKPAVETLNDRVLKHKGLSSAVNTDWTKARPKVDDKEFASALTLLEGLVDELKGIKVLQARLVSMHALKTGAVAGTEDTPAKKRAKKAT